MIFREATVDDIEMMSVVRMAVKENVLNNPGLVTQQDYVDYLTLHGKGWVCEMDNRIVGFAIVGLVQRNIWALFVDPDYEAMGIGKRLHEMMMDWYFDKTSEEVWLSTSPGTRAEKFYAGVGWNDMGVLSNGERKFIMNLDDWKKTTTTSNTGLSI